LPDSFTKGRQDSVEGATTFLPVPNRWLVVRYDGSCCRRTATAWIIESDYRWSVPLENPQNASQVGSMRRAGSGLDKDTVVGVRVGRNVPLATETWVRRATLKLTAVAPGNAALAYYQPACNNVFSLMDPLHGHDPDPIR
jgi:hypothetical protein